MAEPSDPFEAMEKSGVSPPPATDPFEAMENPQRANREVVVPNYLKNMLASEQTWESVAPKLKEQFGVDPKDYEQNYRLGEAHAVQRQQPLSMSEAYRQNTPFGFLGDASGNKAYGAAKRRYDEGKGTKEDAHTIAEYERIQGQLAGVKESFAGKVVTGVGGLSQLGAEMGAVGGALGQVARLPTALGGGIARTAGFGTEAVLPQFGAAGRLLGGGARITATAPSTWVEPARQANVAAGREADDIRGYPTAVGMAYANNLVIGSLQGMKFVDRAPGGLFGRSVAKGTLGAGEAAGVEAAGGIADEFLNDAYKTNTKYGPIGKLLGVGQSRNIGGAFNDFASTAVTFSLFSGLHGAIDKPELNKEKAQAALNKAVEAIDSAKTPEEAAQKVKEIARQNSPDTPDSPDKTASPASSKGQESAPEAPPEAGKPPTQTPAEAEPNAKGLAETVKAAFPDATLDREGNAVVNAGSYSIVVSHNPDHNAAQIDFGERGRGYQKPEAGSGVGNKIQLANAMDNLLGKLRQEGTRVAFKPAEEKTISAFSGVLEKAGFRLVGKERGFLIWEANPGAKSPPAKDAAEAEIVAPERSGGLGSAKDRAAAVEKASQAVQEGKPHTYVEMDVDNLAGLMERAKEGPAKEHVAAMLGIVREELGRVGATEMFKHATDPKGDEHSAIVQGDKAGVDAALARADARIKAYAAEKGIADVPRKSEKPGPQQPGITAFSEPIKPGQRASHIDSEVGPGMETAKLRNQAKERHPREVANVEASARSEGLSKSEAHELVVEFTGRGEAEAARAGSPVLHPEAKQPTLPAANPSAPANRSKSLSGKATEIAVPGSKPVPAHYEVRDLNTVIASHQPLSGGGFRNREAAGEYPPSLQPRDYSKIPGEQEKVRRHANEMKTDYFISSHPDATSGPPTITPDGIVINGNGRHMALEAAALTGKFEKYRADLVARAAEFGIDPKAVAEMKRPGLYRVVDMDARSPEAQRFARAGNVSPTQAQSPVRTAASLGGLIDHNLIDSLRLEGDTTFSEAVMHETKGRTFRNQLRAALPPSEVGRYFHEDGRLTDAGQELVRNMLLSKIVPVEMIEKLGEEAKGVKRTIEGAIPQLLELQRDFSAFAPTPQLVEALGVLVRNPHMRTVNDAKNVLAQGSLFGGMAEPLSPAGRMMLDFVLENGNKSLVFRKRLTALVSDLDGAVNGLFKDENPNFPELAAKALGVEARNGAQFGAIKEIQDVIANGKAAGDSVEGVRTKLASVQTQVASDAHPGNEAKRPVNFGAAASAQAKGPAPSAEVQAPASQAAGWPGSRSAGADIERNAAQLLNEKIAARQTEPGPTAMKRIEPQQAEFAQESGVRWYQSLRDFLRKLGGAKLAATRRLSEDSANAGANVDRSRLYGEAQAEDFNSQIFAGDDRTITRMIAGAVYSEMSLRKLRVDLLNTARKESNAGVQAKNAGDAKTAAEHFRKADEAGAKARNVGTVVGAMNPEESLSSPLGSEADFQHWSKDKDVLAILARADALVTPVNESLYRKAQGLGPNDPIPSKAMIDQPGIPKLSLVSLREGDLTPEQKVLGAEHEDTLPSEPGRGNLARHTLKKLGASRERTGAAKHGYELDLAEIVRRNLVDRQVNADRADYFRTMERSEIGTWSKPGERPHEGWRKLENVRPPKGTQAAEDGQIDFWVHPDAYPDARQLLEPKEQKWQLPLLAASTWATLRSTVDFVSHSRNLLTQWTRGARLRDIFDGVRKQVMDDPAFKKELVEVARLSALSDRHLDIGGGLGKIDPARYAGRVLGLMDRAVRVASLRAYDRLVDRGLDVENTDAARRDFINQVGNYSKLTQNRLVAWLRDTGVGPFSTAATTFWMHGLRTATMRPGVRTNSWTAQLQLQGEMLARVAVLPALAAIANYAFHKRADGDDNTPWGAVKLWTANGKTSYIDLAGLSGLSRGAREIGLKATIESMRPGAKKAGATPGSAADKAARDIGHGLLHPIVGPGVDVIHTLFTGDDAMGYPKAHHVTADEKKKGESQLQYNALAAIFETNSLAEHWLKPIVEQQMGIKKSPAELKNEPTTSEKIGKLFGPFGPVQSKKAPGAPIGSR